MGTRQPIPLLPTGKPIRGENSKHHHHVRILPGTNRFVFYHLGVVDVFHHDRPAFSVSGHLWVDAIYMRMSLFSRASHLIFGHPLGRFFASCSNLMCFLYVHLLPSHHMPIPWHSFLCQDRFDRRHFCKSSDGLISNSVFLVLSFTPS